MPKSFVALRSSVRCAKAIERLSCEKAVDPKFVGWSPDFLDSAWHSCCPVHFEPLISFASYSLSWTYCYPSVYLVAEDPGLLEVYRLEDASVLA